MTENQFCECTETSEHVNEDCTIYGRGHSYYWDEDYVESCEYIDMGIIKYLMFQFYIIDHTIILLGL
jgi:hypothetical protein